MKVELPPAPRDAQYEDFVSAWLSALGYFIETRVRKYNVLELDVVATSSVDSANRLLIEAKSGRWGFADLFKVFGWRSYLDIPQGWLVCSDVVDAEKKALMDDEVTPASNVAGLHMTPDSTDLWIAPIPCVTTADEKDRRTLLEIAWYQRIANRLAYIAFTHACKSNPGDNLLQMARQYDYAVETSFFSSTAQQRIARLYEAFKTSPKLTGAFVDRIAADGKLTVEEIYRRLENEPDLLWLQYVMLLEHRARILIVKNALEVIPPSRSSGPSRGISWAKLSYLALPQSFREGVEKLHSLPFADSVPYVLQLYLEYFGGFHTGDSDLALLARLAGVEQGTLAASLDILDAFFPVGSGKPWCTYSFSGQLVRLKLCPALVRGAGCFMRKRALKLDDYSTFGKCGFLLVQWHNALLSIVGKELTVS
jgi:hypothetical protein